MLTSDELLAAGSEGLGADDHVDGFLGTSCSEQRGKEDRGLLHFFLVVAVAGVLVGDQVKSQA